MTPPPPLTRQPRPPSSTLPSPAAQLPQQPPLEQAEPAPTMTQSSPIGSPEPAAVTDSAATISDPRASDTRATISDGESGRTVPAGTLLRGETSAEICTMANRPGDRFVISLASTVSAKDGSVLPAGTPVLVELARPSLESEFAFRLKGVQLGGEFIPAEGSVDIDNARVTGRSVSEGGDQGKVVTGAVIGAIIGKVFGGGARGAVIGAAGGAAAGTAAAARNTVKEHCLAAGTLLSARLSSGLVLPRHTP